MTDVYSVRFIAEHGLAGSSSFTVPAGQVAIVRDLDSYSNSIGVSDLYLHGSAGQAIWWMEWQPLTPQFGSWRGRQVIEAGETFSVTADVHPGDGIDVTVSGYLLSAP